jgi:Alginate export
MRAGRAATCPQRPFRWGLTLSFCLIAWSGAWGDEDPATPVRPTIHFYRWQEDWSVLADPALRTDWADRLKYIPLAADDPQSYLSFGLTVRERVEYNNAPSFGVSGADGQTYLLHRLEAHMDAHLTQDTRVFVQVENALAPALNHPGPVDANKADVRLFFLDTTGDLDDGSYKIRVGRQEMAFDLQRFVSVRDGPNVRQAYDAIWSDYEKGNWRFSGFLSQPVQYRNVSAFDDFSSGHFRFGGARAQRSHTLNGELSLTVSEYHQDAAHYLAGSGQERRRSVDVRYVGVLGPFDWDMEGVSQGGHVSGRQIDAWAVGTLSGYTFGTTAWTPRLGLQFDAASGDHNLSDQHIGTFNPLFPNGYYFNLSGYTGYTNFIHLKTSLTLKPLPGMTFLGSVGSLWRQSLEDAVYVQPNIPVKGTAGQPGKHTADYVQWRIDYSLSRSLSLATEFDRYFIAPVVRRAGGHDSNYANIELRWGW